MLTKRQQQIIKVPITYHFELYQTTREVGNIISKEKSIDLLYYCSYEPMRYKKLQELTKCKDNTLTRRLHTLVNCGLLNRMDVRINNKKTHEYVITDLGQELIKFFRNYELRRNKTLGRVNGEEIKI